MKREDLRGKCNRECIYCDNGRCNMFFDLLMPDDVNECNIFEKKTHKDYEKFHNYETTRNPYNRPEAF